MSGPTMGAARRPSRREVLGAAAGGAALPLLGSLPGAQETGVVPPILVGSRNGLAGMRAAYPKLLEGAHPLDVALEVVQGVEADPEDTSVGLGGLPNEDGVVTLDAACMDGATHNSGAVAHLENILHPSAVARLVMERTDHCLLVGEGAYAFARAHGHPHTELLTDASRRVWLRWKAGMSDDDDWLSPLEDEGGEEGGAPDRPDANGPRYGATVPRRFERHGTIHCSALAADGRVACTTTTSGLPFKLPGRVGDSPIVGAGLYCDLEAGSVGATGRGEAAILANGSFAIVELLRQGRHPRDAGLEVLARIGRQVERQARWQPALLGADGRPAFDLNFYVVDVRGRWAGVTLKRRDSGGDFALADPEGGARLEPLTPYFE